jgi:hypothetical protein
MVLSAVTRAKVHELVSELGTAGRSASSSLQRAVAVALGTSQAVVGWSLSLVATSLRRGRLEASGYRDPSDPRAPR